jgi:hypothetical protein
VGELRPHSQLRGGTQAPFATPWGNSGPIRHSTPLSQSGPTTHTGSLNTSSLHATFHCPSAWAFRFYSKENTFQLVEINHSCRDTHRIPSRQFISFILLVLLCTFACLRSLSAVCVSVARNVYCCCSVRAVTSCACSRVQYLRVFALNFSKTSSHLLEQMLISSPSARSSYLPIKMTMN